MKKIPNNEELNKELDKIEGKTDVFQDVVDSLNGFIDSLRKGKKIPHDKFWDEAENKGNTQSKGNKGVKINKSRVGQRLFSPVCPNCPEGKMFEIVYSHEVHQELYWCPHCGTLHIEVNCEETWLKPKWMKAKKGAKQLR